MRYVLDQTLMTMPFSSLATAARTVRDFVVAASTLILIQPCGGGCHLLETTLGLTKRRCTGSGE